MAKKKAALFGATAADPPEPVEAPPPPAPVTPKAVPVPPVVIPQAVPLPAAPPTAVVLRLMDAAEVTIVARVQVDPRPSELTYGSRVYVASRLFAPGEWIYRDVRAA